MREIHVDTITQVVRDAVIEANIVLPPCIRSAVEAGKRQETGTLAEGIFCDMLKNMDTAESLRIPVCQDTGMAVIFCEIGQEVHITGGDFEAAVNAGVARGYTEGYLRKSVVRDPLRRENTNDNTPCILHTRIVSGDKICMNIAPKGFGSENMSKLKMFNPTVSEEEILEFITDCVRVAGANPCPPVVVGVGLGGDFEYAALLAKKALCRIREIPNAHPLYAQMEREALRRINALGIGCQGFGGDVSALGVSIEAYPTHIAGLPCAVNMGCHVTRHINVCI